MRLKILQRSSLVEKSSDDFTTPLGPTETYLAPTPSIPILLTKNTHDLFVTRVQNDSKQQLSSRNLINPSYD